MPDWVFNSRSCRPLLLPILLRKTGDIYENFAELSFNDPHVGTIVKYFGLPRLKEPFNSFEIKEMVDRYFASKSLGTGIQILKTNARYGGKKTIIVPTLQEYAEIIKKCSAQNFLTPSIQKSQKPRKQFNFANHIKSHFVREN